jgi:hypothetical protein
MVITRAIQKVTSDELLTKQAMRKKYSYVRRMNALIILHGNAEQYSIQYEDLITASVTLKIEEATTSKALTALPTPTRCNCPKTELT